MTPPVFAHGRLRLYLLSLLAASDQGMHGYELIQALSDRFGGTYVPSAGTIYPRLAKLEDEGLVTKSSDGRKTVYEITEAGRAELTSREHELEDIESEVTDSVRRLADEVRTSVNAAMRTLKAELASAAREARAAGSTTTASFVNADPGRAASNAQLERAEALLAEFRSSVRTELRLRAARGALDSQPVDLLEAGLSELSKTVFAALGR